MVSTASAVVEVATLTAYPWFNVSLVDVYVGFALFGLAFRVERATRRSALA